MNNQPWNKYSDDSVSAGAMALFANKIKGEIRFSGDKRISTFVLETTEEEKALNFLIRNKIVKPWFDIAHKFGGLYSSTTVEVIENKDLLELCEQPPKSRNNPLIDEEFFKFKGLTFKLKLPDGSTRDLNFSSLKEHPYYLFSVLIILLEKNQRKRDGWIEADIINADIIAILRNEFPSEKLSWNNKWISDTKNNLSNKFKSQSFDSFFKISDSKFQNGKRFRTIKLKLPN